MIERPTFAERHFGRDPLVALRQYLQAEGLCHIMSAPILADAECILEEQAAERAMESVH